LPEPLPSPWIERFAGLVPPGGVVLDVACGRGRHTRLFASRGHPVVAIDRDASAVARLATLPGVHAVVADLEGNRLPSELHGRRYAAVVVTNYLHRPLLPVLVASVAEGGALLYETFAAGHERFGRPSNPAFLLAPGELLDAVRGQLRVVAYEDLVTPRPAAVQRIAAVR
jgi:SAM-dependent methyltransferase